MHVNSGGAVVHKNSCNSHAAEVRGGTKPMSSASTLCMGKRPSVKELASSQQVSGRLHGEAWACRVGSLSLSISQEVEIQPGCAVTVSCLPSPFFALESPGPGREDRSWIGWTPLQKTARSGGVVVPGCLAGGDCTHFSL